MSDATKIDVRVQELEIKFMEQQRLLEELSDGLFAQQRRMDELSQRMDRLNQKIAAGPGLVEGDADDKPPHY